MVSQENSGTQTSVLTIENRTQNDKGMAIAGIIVGLIALSLCLFAFNWFTFLVSLAGGIALSVTVCLSKKQNNAIVIVSIVCSTVALIIGLINYPEVLNPIIDCLSLAAWLLERVKDVWGEWASSLNQLF